MATGNFFRTHVFYSPRQERSSPQTDEGFAKTSCRVYKMDMPRLRASDKFDGLHTGRFCNLLFPLLKFLRLARYG